MYGAGARAGGRSSEFPRLLPVPYRPGHGNRLSATPRTTTSGWAWASRPSCRKRLDCGGATKRGRRRAAIVKTVRCRSVLGVTGAAWSTCCVSTLPVDRIAKGFPGLKGRHPSGGDGNGLSGPGIASLSCCPIPCAERSETGDGNGFARNENVGDGRDHRVGRGGRIGVGQRHAARCSQRSDRFTVGPPRAVDGRCSTIHGVVSSVCGVGRRTGDVCEDGALRSGHGEHRDRQGQTPARSEPRRRMGAVGRGRSPEGACTLSVEEIICGAMRRSQGPSGAPAAAGPARARFQGTMAPAGNAGGKAIAESRTGTRRRLILRTGAEDGICERSCCPIASCSARQSSTCSSARSNVFPNEKARRSGRQSERYGGPDQGPTAGSGLRTSAVALLRSLTMRLTFRA